MGGDDTFSQLVGLGWVVPGVPGVSQPMLSVSNPLLGCSSAEPQMCAICVGQKEEASAKMELGAS